MKTTKSSLIDWHVTDDSGRIVGRITKDRGIYKVWLRDMHGVMEHMYSSPSFFDAKHYAIKNA